MSGETVMGRDDEAAARIKRLESEIERLKERASCEHVWRDDVDYELGGRLVHFKRCPKCGTERL